MRTPLLRGRSEVGTIAEMLDVRDGWFRYNPKGEWILRGFDLMVSEGDLIHIRGESGGGKTTALKILNRLIEIDRGNFLWNGKPVAKIPAAEYRAKVIYVPQEPFMRQGSVSENMYFPFSFAAHRNKPLPSTKQTRALLESFGLAALKDDDPAKSLSVGQMMRLSVIRSLLLNPKILLLDEPLAGLDDESRRLFETGIMTAREERKLSVVIVSHIPLEYGLRRNHVRDLYLREGRFISMESGRE